MSQHDELSCNESNELWLPLIEYSIQSGLSLSTLRRKIKDNSISFRLEKGRYLILFNRTANAPRPHHSLAATDLSRWQDEPLSHINQAPSWKKSEPSDEAVMLEFLEKELLMLNEAYEHALKNKEERISYLEKRNRELTDRTNELRLLVQVLEEKYKVRY